MPYKNRNNVSDYDRELDILNGLSPIIVNPLTAAKATVIFFHGLGADAGDVAPIATKVALPSDLGVRFVFPNAHYRMVTMYNGHNMRCWFDMRSIDCARADVDSSSIEEAQEWVDLLIKNQVRQGISTERIVLAGFSQGGGLALYAGLRYPSPLAGILALSAYLPCEADVLKSLSKANHHTPVLLAHGHFDDVISLGRTQRSSQLLKQAGWNVDFKDYNMSHEICEEEMRDVGLWLQTVLK